MTQTEWIISIDDDLKDYDELFVGNVRDGDMLTRCRDCIWYGRSDKRRFYRGMDCLQKRIDTIVPDKDYCSRAERRKDEIQK